LTIMSRLSALSAVCLVILCTANVHAAVIQWVGHAGGAPAQCADLWSQSACWSSGTVPGPQDDVIMDDVPVRRQLTVDVDISINSIEMGTNSSGQSQVIAQGGSSRVWNVSTTWLVGATGGVYGSGGPLIWNVAGDILNYGQITIMGNSFADDSDSESDSDATAAPIVVTTHRFHQYPKVQSQANALTWVTATFRIVPKNGHPGVMHVFPGGEILVNVNDGPRNPAAAVFTNDGSNTPALLLNEGTVRVCNMVFDRHTRLINRPGSTVTNIFSDPDKSYCVANIMYK